MKQRLLFVLASLMMSLGAMADEWVQPVPASQPINYGDTIYLYNKEAHAFLLGANYWGTYASLGTTGYKCILTETESGVQIADSAETKGKFLFIRAKAIEDIYVDCSDADIAASYWTITAQEGNDFTIATKTTGLEGMFLGVDLSMDNKTVLHLIDPDGNYTEGTQILWNCVSPAAYAQYLVEENVYEKAVSLGNKIEEAESYGLDVDAAKAVYANTSSSVDALSAAIEEVQNAINYYKENSATPDDPQDLTSTYIPDGDFELNQGSGVWQRTHSAQNYQTSGTPNKMGDATYFLESWNGSNFSGKMYVPIVGLPNGVYQFSLSAATNGTAATYIYAGSDSVEVTTGSTMTSYTVFTKVSNDSLEVGYCLPTAGQNWVGIDDAKLLYLGNSKDSYSYWVKTMMDNAPKYDDDTFVQASLLAEYNKLIETDPYSLASVDEVLAYYENYKAKLAEIKANAAAYAAYEALSDVIDQLNEAGYQGDEANALYDYKTEKFEEITTAKSLTTEEMIAETEMVNKMIEEVKTKCLATGMDCTNLLTNANFDTGIQGWSHDSQYADGAWGGLSSNPDVERWNDNFDFYQEVSNVPNGVYELKVQAFYRPTGSTSGSYQDYINDPTTDPILAYIYGNSTKKEVCNIAAYSYSENLENNCEASTNLNGETVYIPNGMNSASNAFSRGDYENSLQCVVTDGTLRVGIKSTEGTISGRWTLWDNFRLKYLGMDEDVLANLFDETKASAEVYLESVMGATELSALKTAIDANPTTGTETFNAIIALNSAVKDAESSIAAYEKLNAALIEFSNTVESYAGSPMINEAENVYYEVNEKYEQCSYTVAETEDAISKLNVAIAKVKVPAEIGDWTSLIVNPAFDDGNATGWNYKFAAISNIGYQSNQPYVNGDVSISQFIEGWRSGNAAIGDGSINQTIYYLPVGVYSLGVDAIANLQSITDTSWEEKVTGVYLYASQNGQILAQQAIKTGNGLPEHFDLTFPVKSDGEVEIGIMTKDATANWIAADNWTLTCTSNNPADNINSVVATSTSAAAGIYSISGVRINKAQKGINIVNGKKVVVK